MVPDLEAAVDAIWASAQAGRYYPAEWRGRLDLDRAYRVQLGILDRHLTRGQVQAGWKVGLTARAIQLQAGIHEPVFGFLLAAGACPSGTVFPFAELIEPGFENELCLTLGRPLRGPGVTPAMARVAVAGVAPALEIVERRGDAMADPPLSVADNCQQRAFVTGRSVPLPDGFDLVETTVEVRINGVSQERATGAEVMGTPLASLAWLANRLADFGRGLEAGQRVMSGSFTRQYAIARGDAIEARFAPFGTVAARFV